MDNLKKKTETVNIKELINEYQLAILDIYKQEDIQCLRGFDNKYKIKNKQIIMWFFDVTRRCNIKYPLNFNYFKNIDDLLLCSDEIMHFTGQLYLYRPFLNNPLIDAIRTVSGKLIFPNLQNLEAKRYYMYSDIAYEKIYNYWDRIGDLIASFFPEQIKLERVFFTTALDKVPKEFQSNDAYKWLLNFKENGYHMLNSKRKDIVHYTSSNTNGKYSHLFNSGNKKDIIKWVEERHSIADKLKEQIRLTIDGFYYTLLFLEAIDNTLFEDIE